MSLLRGFLAPFESMSTARAVSFGSNFSCFLYNRFYERNFEVGEEAAMARCGRLEGVAA
jgi:hypothetical protein